ncbi:putative 2-phosphosulfolactate phosphatase [Vulcanimicrobium alpinum]|uniref:Probable 2-phosphosulfolactate phosphatase n=1 Tax=Vulcanimicrobium alpinum TaxID=3016050 RepID=A0AAN1XWI6_UNVUL|nr:2-phosphosulfolactate phosphatase [Vulcanimicrobium alpinum]BDE06280.1 putative 2-phosphosulfolactate phosphatase [Vulcanimicrobium alpinum]
MTRAIDVLLAPPFSADALREKHVAVVDVLRATSTIATALANGAAGVIPVSEPEDAVTIGNRLGRDRVLLCGERNSVRIPGFDADNSPASFPPSLVDGKTLVMTTTNGTRALRAVSGAASVRTAALVNRTAVADALAAESGDIAIVCAGEPRGFALEDAIGAGALVDLLLTLIGDIELRDGARASALLFRSVAARLADAVASADHAQALANQGFAGDITRCAALDTIAIAPTLRDGMLVAG